MRLRAAHAARRRGAILLEVVLAVTLFVLSAALVGAAVRGGLSASDSLARRTRGLALAQSVLAQIRCDYLAVEHTSEGEFTPHFPGYRYAVNVTGDINLPTLRNITVTVSWDVPAELGRAAFTDSVTLTGWEYRALPQEEEQVETSAQPAGGSDGGQRP